MNFPPTKRSLPTTNTGTKNFFKLTLNPSLAYRSPFVYLVMVPNFVKTNGTKERIEVFCKGGPENCQL